AISAIRAACSAQTARWSRSAISGTSRPVRSATSPRPSGACPASAPRGPLEILARPLSPHRPKIRNNSGVKAPHSKLSLSLLELLQLQRRFALADADVLLDH